MIIAICGAVIIVAAIGYEFSKEDMARTLWAFLAAFGLGGLLASRYYEDGWEDAITSAAGLSVALIFLGLTNRPRKINKTRRQDQEDA